MRPQVEACRAVNGYLCCELDGRPGWCRPIRQGSELVRRGSSRLPFSARKTVTSAIAAAVYGRFSRSAWLVERAGGNPSNISLSAYRDLSFVSMRTDALDPFGTQLEHRSSPDEIADMMPHAGLIALNVSNRSPFWVTVERNQQH